MRQYTTPTYTFTVKDIDLTAMDDVLVTFADTTRTIIVTKDSPTVTASGDDTTVKCSLTQAETGRFWPNTKADAQINWLDGTKRCATEIIEIDIKENLIKEILPNA